MNAELYKKLFASLDRLWAIRKDLTFWCEVFPYLQNWFPKNSLRLAGIMDYKVERGDTPYFDYVTDIEIKYSKLTKIIGHPPVLSDCIKANMSSDHTAKFNPTVSEECHWIVNGWDMSKPLLSDQSDELGEKLLKLLPKP